MSLDGFDPAHPEAAAELAEKMIRKLRAGMMPPTGLPQPEARETAALVEALEHRIDAAADARPAPGSRPSQRINRAEYQRLIEDLLGLHVDPGEWLPEDPVSASFDNIADVQTVTLRTDVGQLVGTVSYMSPEQVKGDSSNLDTRSDIYTLGVILYELLSGKLPYELRSCSIPEAARIIQEEDPTRLSSINPAFRGDLETMVQKALEKERDRRYPSAAAMARDIAFAGAVVSKPIAKKTTCRWGFSRARATASIGE